jgi:hypothetical protein
MEVRCRHRRAMARKRPMSRAPISQRLGRSLTQRRFNKLPPYTSADNTVIQKLVGQSV